MESASNITRGVTSNTTKISGPYIIEPQAVVVFRLTIESCAAFLGVIGSILVCLVVAKGDRTRAGSLYIISLAIADLFILVVNFPIAVIKEQSPTHWPLGKELCYAMYPLLEMFHGACIWSIVAIAVERYRGIIHTRRQSIKSVKLTIGLVWFGSFVLFVVPLLFIITYTEISVGHTFCYLKWPSPLMFVVYNIMDIILLYVFPLAIISFTYLSITKEINASSVLHKRLSKSAKVRRKEELKRVKQNTKTKKLLTPLVVVFTITMLPLNAFRIAVLCMKSFNQHELFLIFYNICVIGVVLNSLADPIIYSIVTKGFLSRLKSMFIKETFNERSTSSMTGFRPADRETDV